MTYDNLIGGTSVRLKAMRNYRDRWNADPGRIERNCLLKPGFAGILQARSHGIGLAARSATATQSADGNCICADTGYLFHLREPEEMPRDYGRGWYTDGPQCVQTIAGRVAKLPTQCGIDRYLAYTVPSDHDGITIDANTYDDPCDAWAAADSMAERQAEQEQEYNARWDEAQRLGDAIWEKRNEVTAIRKVTASYTGILRVLHIDAPRERQTLCAFINEQRDNFHEALDELIYCHGRYDELQAQL